MKPKYARASLAKLSEISENQCQAQVIELAKLYAWLVSYTDDSKRSASGFSDLVLMRPPGVLLVEVNSARERF